MLTEYKPYSYVSQSVYYEKSFETSMRLIQYILSGFDCQNSVYSTWILLLSLLF